MNQGRSLHWLFIVAIFDISKEYVLHTIAIVVEIQQQLPYLRMILMCMCQRGEQ
jgi:hypothetical protein